jgi:hypothetical protein
MSKEFSELLRGIAGEEESGYARAVDERPDDLRRFVTKVRRRRLARQGAVSFVSAGAVAALALDAPRAGNSAGGAASTRASQSTGWASGTPSPRASRSPTGGVIFAPEARLFLGACGTKIADAATLGTAIVPLSFRGPETDPARVPEPVAALTPTDGSTVSLRAAVYVDVIIAIDGTVFDPGRTGTWKLERAMVAVQDGVVVSQLDASGDGLTFDQSHHIGTESFQGPLVAQCDWSAKTNDKPLPAGTYEIWAGVQLSGAGLDAAPIQRLVLKAGSLTVSDAAALQKS